MIKLYINSMVKIGNLELQGKLILAPLAGVSDIPFRVMCKSMGAALTFTEMTSSEGLVRGNTKTLRYIQYYEYERPIGIQISGTSPAIVAEAAEKLMLRPPDVIDFNVGCPVRKVVRRGAGAALLRDLEKLGKIIEALVKAVPVPVTVKIRSGWTDQELVALDVVSMIEEMGAAALTLHPRTRKSNYSVKADWSLIREAKKRVKIPVIGNGDVFTPEDAKNMLEETGCDLVMIARGSLGRPWIFNQIQTYLDTGVLIPPPSFRERISICLKHLDLAIKEKGIYLGTIGMRKQIAWYTFGMPGSARLRAEIMTMKSFDEIRRRFESYMTELDAQKEAIFCNDTFFADPDFVA